MGQTAGHSTRDHARGESRWPTGGSSGWPSTTYCDGRSYRNGREQPKNLIAFTGLSGVAIGAYHFALGTASVPGASDANTTVDSRERFYSAFFAGYGFAWLSAARKRPILATDVRLLAALMLLGGVGRSISLIDGHPHWFQEVLTVMRSSFPQCFSKSQTARRAE